MNRNKTLESIYPEACMKLRSWGQWSRDSNNMGYPHLSIEQAAIEGAGIDTRGSGMKTIPDNPDAEEMEKLLIVLRDRHLKQYLSIKFYFQSSTMTYQRMTKILGIGGKEKVRETLGRAVAWIDGGLHN